MRTTFAIVFVLTLVWDTYAKPPQAPLPPQGPPVRVTPQCGKESCDCGCKDGNTCTCAAREVDNVKESQETRAYQPVSYRVYTAPVYSTPVYSQPVYSQPTYSQPVYSYQQPVYSAPSYSTPVYSAPRHQPSYTPQSTYRSYSPPVTYSRGYSGGSRAGGC